MGLPKVKVTTGKQNGKASSAKKGDSASEFVENSLTNELVFALCGPVGSEFNKIVSLLKKEIGESRAYTAKEIKVSDLIRDKLGIENDPNDTPKQKLEKKNQCIKGGDTMRKNSGHADLLAAGVVADIRSIKDDIKDKVDDPDRICFIINSLKNTAEAKLLKSIYGESFFMIGVNTPYEKRVMNLTMGDQSIKSDAEKTIRTDEQGSKDIEPEFSQQVGKLFHYSDFFINVDGEQDRDAAAKITRFANVIFGTEVITPNIHEKSMYSAWAAASNSACLSRQVGAAVTSNDGMQLSVGWNDVPKFGGGVYNEENARSKTDNRCYIYAPAGCRNGKKLQNAKNKLYNELINAPHLGLNAVEHGEIVEKIISESEIFNATEYSRAIHAEMHAIFNAFQSHSTKVVDGSLYVTTYPCHNCARHIVLSGIKKIYYISPYPKSLAIELHPDTLTRDTRETKMVQIIHFEGIAPTKYLSLFSLMDLPRKDKTTNNLPPNPPDKATPRCQINLESINHLEKNIALRFNSYLEQNR